MHTSSPWPLNSMSGCSHLKQTEKLRSDMTKQTRLRRLGAAAPPRTGRDRDKDYWDALWLTNTTGLAKLRHYQLALGPLAREHRDWLCAVTPFLSALGRHTHDVGGLVTVGTHPP